MKPEFDKIGLNRQVLLVFREGTRSFSRFENELSGTVLTTHTATKIYEHACVYPTHDDILIKQSRMTEWIVRDDVGEIFVVPYEDIESIQYL
jgi:hypothetical protein